MKNKPNVQTFQPIARSGELLPLTYLDFVLERMISVMLIHHLFISAFLTFPGTNYAGLTAISSSEEIMVDVSPPRQGEIVVNTNHYPRIEVPVITSRHLSIYLTGFVDEQSGISYFQVGIGTHELVDDLMPMTDYIEESIKFSLNEEQLVDGYGYYILATVTPS